MSAAKRVGFHVTKQLGFNPKDAVGKYIARMTSFHLYGIAQGKKGAALRNPIGLAAFISESDFHMALTAGEYLDSATKHLLPQYDSSNFRAARIVAGPMQPIPCLMPDPIDSELISFAEKFILHILA